MTNAENTKKQKTLMPSLKENQRYVAYSIESRQISDEHLDSHAHNNIISQCIALLGMFESAKAGVMPVKHKQGKGILRVNSRYMDKLKICLGTIKSLNIKGKEFPAKVECIYVSGMLNKAEKMIA